MASPERIIKALYGGAKAAVEQSIQAYSQINPVTNLLGDIYGFGYQGGPIEGGNVREIIMYKGKVAGFRNYDENQGERPLEWKDDLKIHDKIFINPGGYLIGEPLTVNKFYDNDFERWGSASRLTNGDYRDIEDKSRLAQHMLNDTLSWYAKHGGKRRTLKDAFGIPDTDYKVVEIPRASRGFFQKFDPKSWDPSLAFYLGLQSVAYKIPDDLIYEPLVEGLIRKINKNVKKVRPEAGNIRMDAFVESEYVAISELVNTIFDLPSPNELYYQGDLANVFTQI